MTKEKLKEYIKLNIELEQLGEELIRLNEQLTSPKSPILSDMPRGGSAMTMADRICRVAKLSEEYYRKWDAVMTEREKIEIAVDNLADPLERAVLRYRYIDGLTWEKIALKIQYEWAQVHRLHNKALRNLDGYGVSALL